MFDERYTAVLADTDEAKAVHYNLRYQVYCMEKAYETPDTFEAEMEVDQYDQHSVHFLIQEKITGRWLATMRLVIAEADRLPMRKIAAIDCDPTNNRGKIAELSRLSIIDHFRHDRERATEYRASIPEILLGLIRAATRYSTDQGINQWMFLCKRSMMRILNECGMAIHNIGPRCEHRGIRYPYWADLENGFEDLSKAAPKVFDMFSKDVAYWNYSELYGLQNQAA